MPPLLSYLLPSILPDRTFQVPTSLTKKTCHKSPLIYPISLSNLPSRKCGYKLLIYLLPCGIPRSQERWQERSDENAFRCWWVLLLWYSYARRSRIGSPELPDQALDSPTPKSPRHQGYAIRQLKIKTPKSCSWKFGTIINQYQYHLVVNNPSAVWTGKHTY